MLPPTDGYHIFADIKDFLPPDEFKELNLNLVVNWLKHYKQDDPEPVFLTEFETVIALARAVTKYHAVYRETTTRMVRLLEWAVEQGYPVTKAYLPKTEPLTTDHSDR